MSTTATTALVFHLRADPGVAALAGTRIYQALLPQSPTYPAAVLTTVSEPQSYQLRGLAGLTGTRVQADSYAPGKTEVDGLAAAIDLALSGRRFSASGVRFTEVLRVNRIDTYDGAELRVFRVMLEYLVQTRSA